MCAVIVIFQLTIPSDLLRSQFDKTGNAILRVKADNLPLPTKLLLSDRRTTAPAYETTTAAAAAPGGCVPLRPTPFTPPAPHHSRLWLSTDRIQSHAQQYLKSTKHGVNGMISSYRLRTNGVDPSDGNQLSTLMLLSSSGGQNSRNKWLFET